MRNPIEIHPRKAGWGLFALVMLLTGCTTSGLFGSSSVTTFHTSIRSQQIPQGMKGDALAHQSTIDLTYQNTSDCYVDESTRPDWLHVGGSIEMEYVAFDLGALSE